MGNKQSKAIYDKLATAFTSEEPAAESLSLPSLSEPEVVAYLLDIVARKTKCNSLQDSLTLNTSPKEADDSDSSLKSLLAAGHESRGEIERDLRSQRVGDAVAPGLQSVREFSQGRAAELVVSLLVALERAERRQTASFYERVGRELSATSATEQSSGIGAALYFAALLIDPKKLLVDEEMSGNVLNMFATMTPLAFYEWTSQNLIIDRSIEYIKRSLLAQIESVDVKGNAICLENAIKILCCIGLARGSVEDLLTVVELMKKLELGIDLADVLKTVLDLPEASAKPFSLQSSALDFSIPFEKMYIDKSSWVGDKEVEMTCATDGEYLYLYNNIHGLLVLGVGEGKCKGRVYERKGFIKHKGKLQLLSPHSKIHCLANNELFKLDISSMHLHDPLEMPCTAKDKVATAGHLFAVYTEKSREESDESENPKVRGDVVVYDLESKIETRKCSIVHGVSDLNSVVLCKNVLILAGSKRYEIIDLDKNSTIKKGESDLLKQAAICCHQDTNKLFIVHSASAAKGLVLGQADLIHLQEQTPSFLSAKIVEIKKLLAIEAKESNDVASKHKLASLLGIYTEAEEVKDDQSIEAKTKPEYVLAALAYRSTRVEHFMTTADAKDYKEIMKVYKSPLAVHITARCFAILFKLLQEYFSEFAEGRREVLESMCYVMIILSEHFFALKKCNVSLEDCIGPEAMKIFAGISKEVILPIADNVLEAKYKVEDKAVASTVRQFAASCMKHFNALGKADIEETFNLLHELLEKYTRQEEPSNDLSGLIDWLSIPDNAEALANRILSQDKTAVSILDLYFSIEANYFSQMFHDSSRPIQSTYKKMACPFSLVIEKLFISVWKRMESKDEQTHDFIISGLPLMLHKHLKNIAGNVKDSYQKHIAKLKKNKEELAECKRTGVEYAKYWKLVGNLLNNDIYLFHCYFTLTTIVMGVHLLPEQCTSLAHILLDSASELKDILASLFEDKALLLHLEEVCKAVEQPMKSSVAAEVEFEFPEASELRIVSALDIPPPNKNEVTVSDHSKSKTLLTLTRSSASRRATVRANKIVVSIKIEYAHKTDFEYSGYHIRIIPKYVYGQRIIKKLLRKAVWTVGYLARGALDFYESSKQFEGLMQEVLSSGLLSGGLPSEHFSKLNKGIGIGGSSEETGGEAVSDLVKAEKESVKKLLAVLNEDYLKDNRSDDLAEELVRMVFALLLKLTGKINEWVQAKSEEDVKRLTPLWKIASQMRAILQSKHSKIIESEAPENVGGSLKAAAQSMKDKVNILLRFRSAKIKEPSKKTVQIVIEDTDAIRRRLAVWREIQTPVQEEAYDDSLFAPIINILESNITAAQMAARLESYNSRAATLHSVMDIMQRSLKSLHSKKIRADTLAWTMTIFRRTLLAPWHYSQSTISCGALCQTALRKGFFGVVREVLKGVLLSKNAKELCCLVDALKWDYASDDCSELINCKVLETLRGTSKGEYVSTIWGLPLASKSSAPSFLLSTFEFIALKVVTLPNLSDVESAAAELLETILRIIFNEIKNAADSYESSKGIEISLINDYMEINKESKKPKDEDDVAKDRRKISKTFKSESEATYSNEFCTQLLNLLYKIITILSQEMHKAVSKIIQTEHVLQLLRLVQVGSMHQQFLVLRVIPLVGKFCVEKVEQAAQETAPRYTDSPVLDFLLNFIVQRREGIWTPEIKVPSGTYSITKCAVAAAQILINTHDSINSSFHSLLNTVVFGSKEDWAKMSVECKSRRLIETVLSVAGAEAVSLHKGARVSAGGKKGFVIAGFNGLKKDLAKSDWEFAPKSHTHASVHLASDEASNAEAFLEEASVLEIIPKNQRVNIEISAKPKEFQELLRKAVETPLPDNSILATIQVKTIRFLQTLLSKNKRLSEEVLTRAFAEELLEKALERTRSPQSRSLKTAEFAVEEMRRTAGQSEGKALGTPDSNLPTAKVLKHELLLLLRNASLSLPLIAYRNTESLRGEVLEYHKCTEDTTTRKAASKILFLPKPFEAKAAELSKEAKLLVVASPLESLENIESPAAQISGESMGMLGRYEELLAEMDGVGQGKAMDKVVAEYLGVKGDQKIDVMNAKDIAMKLLGNESEEGKIAVESKEVRKTNPLRTFTQQSFKCDKMIREHQSLRATDEAEQLRKDFCKAWPSFCERAECAAPEVYLVALADLRLFYTRKLVLNYLGTVGCVCRMDKILDFLLVMAIEADYLLYGFEYKGLSKKVKRVMGMLANSEVDFISIFAEWLSGKLNKMRQNLKNPSNLFGNSAEELREVVYVRFLRGCLQAFLKQQPLKLLRHPEIGGILTNVLTLVPIIQNPYDKHRCLLLIKQVVCHVQTLQYELSRNDLNRILANKAMRALSAYCREKELSMAILWQAILEAVLHATDMANTAHQRFAEQSVTYCASDSERLNTNMEILREFPRMEKLVTYSWTRMFAGQVKAKSEFRVDTPKPLYNTQYCLLIESPLTQAVTVSSKKKAAAVGMISLDKEMKARRVALDKSEEKFAVNLTRFYLHFPLAGYTVYAFGSNEGGRLGLKDLKTVCEPKAVPGLGQNEIKAVFSAGMHSLVLDVHNSLFTAGKGDGRIGLEGSGFSGYTKKGVSSVCATNLVSSVIYDADENILYVSGKNPDKMFIAASNDCNENEFIPVSRDLRQVSISNKHMLMLYGDKQLYASPESKKEVFGTWAEDCESKFCAVSLSPDVLKVRKILAINSGSLLLCDTETSRGVLYSFGTQAPGLGQGASAAAGQYVRLSYADSVEFADLVGCENMVAAVTEQGELYTWGKAYKGALGLYSAEGAALEEVNIPTKVALPEGTVVLHAAVGFNHMLVLAHAKDTSKRIVYGFGDNSKNQLGEKDINANKSVITFFADKIPYLVAAGHSCSFVACGKKYEGIVHDCVCGVHGVKVRDILYFERTKDGFAYYCGECGSSVPEIVMAVRNPIARLEERPWPFLDSLELKAKDEGIVDCSGCASKIEEGAVYKSAVKEVESVLCEKCFLKSPATFVPSVYYRIATAKSCLGKEFPTLSLRDLYETTDEYISLLFTLKYKLFLPPSCVEKPISPSLGEFQEESKRFSRTSDLSLVDLINSCLVDENKEIAKLSLKSDFNLPYAKKAILSHFPEDALKRRTKVLIKFNKIILRVLQCIDFEGKPTTANDFYRLYAKAKDYLAVKTKDQIFKKVTTNMSKVRGRTMCVLDWSRAKDLPADKRTTLYEQMWQHLKNNVRQFFKPQKKDKLPFRLKFKGKESADPKIRFEEVLVQISAELQSGNLPLLVPTENNRRAYGDYREKWTLNPSATEPKHLSMLEFLGALIGLCFIFKYTLALNLSSIFWKQIIGDSVGRADLRRMDAYCAQCLEDIGDIDKKGIDSATFGEVVDNSFATRLSDGSEEELKAGGKAIKVTYESRQEYVQLVRKARLSESFKQAKAVRTGLLKVVPGFLLKLYSWREVERKVCDDPVFNVQLLQSMTKYIDCSEDDSHIQYFWKALTQLAGEERLLYLRFVSGRSRIAEDLAHTIGVKQCDSPDEALPEAVRYCGV